MTNEQKIIAIACAVHQQNKTYCEMRGDTSQVPWSSAPANIKASAIDGVRNALAGATPQQSHENWLAFKRKDGWIYGEVKDAQAKTHPCMVPYDKLPPEERHKDHLFIEMVQQMAVELMLP